MGYPVKSCGKAHACCDICRPGWRAKLSAGQRRRYEDPAEREKISTNNATRRPEVAAKISIADSRHYNRQYEERWDYPWLRQHHGRWEVRFPWADEYARLHRTGIRWVKQAWVVWVQAHGPIPKNSSGRSYDIHHVNGDPLDDRLENLQCLTRGEHCDFHGHLAREKRQ